METNENSIQSVHLSTADSRNSSRRSFLNKKHDPIKLSPSFWKEGQSKLTTVGYFAVVSLLLYLCLYVTGLATPVVSIILSLGVFLQFLAFSSFGLFFGTVGWLVLFYPLAIGIVVAALYNWLNTFTQADTIEIHENGISVGWGRRSMFSVNWNDIGSVFLFCPHHTMLPRKWLVGFGTQGSRPVTIKLPVFGNKGMVLLETLKNKVPWMAIDPALIELWEPAIADSHTELWLKSLSNAPKGSELMPLFPGEKLRDGKYTIINRLGVGGQGTAYLAAMKQANSQTEEVSQGYLTLEERFLHLEQGGDVTGSGPAVTAEDDINNIPTDGVSESEQAKEHGAENELTSNFETHETGNDRAHSIADPEEPPPVKIVTDTNSVVIKETIFPVYVDPRIRTEAEDRFKLEVELLNRLRHPQIVSLNEAFIEGPRGYLVLEYIEGDSLRKVVRKDGALPESEVLDLAIQMADILQYLHTLKPAVIHRDFTPDNLMLGNECRVKLIDFNVAREVESTRTATVVGKHAYLPPEQFRGDACTQSDIYAFGATLFFLLVGEDPEPISQSFPAEANSAVSPGMNQIVAKCTDTELTTRYPFAEDIGADLRALLELKS